MRIKIIWAVAVIAGTFVLASAVYYAVDSSRLLPGVENSSAFIERFNAGNPPDGLVLGDAIVDDSFYSIGGFICRVVPVVGNEDIRFLVYSRERDGRVYAIRVDEIVDAYTDPTRLVEINDYLYRTFFKYASKSERKITSYDLEPLTWTKAPISIFFLDYTYCNRLFNGTTVDQSGQSARSVIYSLLSHKYTEYLVYPN